MACAKYREEHTASGEDYHVGKSALQKYVRRGDAARAMRVAADLETVRRAPEAEGARRISTGLRHRLLIVCLEDCAGVGALHGLAATAAEWPQPATPVRWAGLLAGLPGSRAASHARAVASARGAADGAWALSAVTPQGDLLYGDIMGLHVRFEADPRRARAGCWADALVEALLVRDPVAVLWAWHIAEHGAPAPPRPWNGRGALVVPRRRRGAVWTIFQALWDAATVRWEDPVPRAGDGRPQPVRAWREALEAVMHWVYDELKGTKEAFLCWMAPLLAILRLRDPPVPVSPPPADDPAVAAALAAYAAAPRLAIADFARDIHTGHGPRKGRGGYVRFALEGAVVANPCRALIDARWEAFYVDRKRVLDSLPVEGGPPVAAEAEKAEDAPAPPPTAEERAAMDAYLEALYAGMAGEADGADPAPPAPGDAAAGPPALGDAAAAEPGDAAAEGPGLVLREPPGGWALAEFIAAFEELEDAAGEGAPFLRETEVFRGEVLRAQLVTGRARACTYFARPPGWPLVVVKGPFRDGAACARAVAVAAWKERLGLPVVPLAVVRLCPDRWRDPPPPLGVRARMPPGEPAPFLVALSVVGCEGGLPPSEVRTSKLWPATRVACWKNAWGRPHVWNPLAPRSPQVMEDYVLHLLARYVLAIGDPADRNFLEGDDGRLYSLDEDSGSGGGAFALYWTKLRKKRCDAVRAWLDREWPRVAARVARRTARRAPPCDLPGRPGETVAVRLARVQGKESALALFEDPQW
jgi:hypothetical protein